MTQDSIRCSQCGGSEGVGSRFAACVATSVVHVPIGIDYRTRDDIRLWRVGLCDACMSNAYRSFLRHRLKKVSEQLFWCTFLLIIGVLAIKFIDPMWLFAPLRLLYGATVVVGLLAGVLGVPICVAMLIANFLRLKALERSGVVPAKRVDKAFIGEGQRIIDERTHGRAGSPDSDSHEFPLPESRSGPGGDRDIEAVASTIDELKKLLSAESKTLLELPRDNQQEDCEAQ